MRSRRAARRPSERRHTLFRTSFSSKLCPAIVKTKHGKNIPSVMITAPAKAFLSPPSLRPPWKPTNVAKITNGAGRTLPMAMQSMKTRCVSQAPFKIASTWMNGIAVYAPPKERLPATNPRTNKLMSEGVGAIPRARATGEGMPRKTTYIAYPTYWRIKRTMAGAHQRRALRA